MAGLVIVKVMELAVLAVLLVAPATSQSHLELVNTSTPDPSASAMNTTLPSTSSSPYLSPAFVTLASLCILLALSTLVLSILLCLRCASDRNGLGQAAFSSDSTTFKSTEALVNDQAYFPYNQTGRGSLHISENSLYGVI